MARRRPHPEAVEGEGAGLIGADGRAGGHRLARIEVADEVVVVEHLAHGEGEGHRDGERQALRHGDDEHGDRVDDVLVHDAQRGEVGGERGAGGDGVCRELRRERGGRGHRAEAADGVREVLEFVLEDGVGPGAHAGVEWEGRQAVAVSRVQHSESHRGAGAEVAVACGSWAWPGSQMCSRHGV